MQPKYELVSVCGEKCDVKAWTGTQTHRRTDRKVKTSDLRSCIYIYIRYLHTVVIGGLIIDCLLYISTYINTKMSVCVSVCLFDRVFLGHLESDLETLWLKVDSRPRMSSKTIKFQKKVIFRRVVALFLYFFKISL